MTLKTKHKNSAHIFLDLTISIFLTGVETPYTIKLYMNYSYLLLGFVEYLHFKD